MVWGDRSLFGYWEIGKRTCSCGELRVLWRPEEVMQSRGLAEYIECQTARLETLICLEVLMIP